MLTILTGLSSLYKLVDEFFIVSLSGSKSGAQHRYCYYREYKYYVFSHPHFPFMSLTASSKLEYYYPFPIIEDNLH